MRKKILKLAFIFIIFIVSISTCFAADFTHVLSNSDNWRDVYSIVHFATLNKVDSDFLVSTRHGPLLLGGLSKDSEYLIISSEDRAYVINYLSIMESQDFENVKELEVDNANLELIEQLPNIRNFIIVGNNYGYYAVSAAPYAVVKDSWVFFADRNNIDEIDAILEDRSVDELLIYGGVDREVSDALSKYNPEIIDSGDRFKDNTEIVDRYLEINPTKQIILTNGEFIEKEIMTGVEPILFTGKENVPDEIRDYIKASDLEVGVLIGSDLVGAATNIRRSTGISVIAKFARGSRQNTGAIATVEGLDLFYLPTPVVSLLLHSARYNKASNQLQITYKSESNIPIYFKGTVTYLDENGQTARRGEADVEFISPNDYKTMVYEDVVVRDDTLSLDIFTLYGDAISSLDKILEAKIDAEIVDVLDKCEIDLQSIAYNNKKDEFIIKIKNLGKNTCYADAEIVDFIVDGKETNIGISGAVKIKPDGKVKVKIPFELTEEDIEDNEYANVNVYYGEREDSLTKLIKAKLPLEIIGILYLVILVLVILIIIVLIIFFILLWRRRRKDDDFY